MHIFKSRIGAVVTGAFVLAIAGGGTAAVADRFIDSSDVRNGSLGMRDLNEFTKDQINQSGPAGPQGERGPAGADGQDGVDGKDGAPGATGPAGAQGPKGDQGKPGDDGVSGYEVRTWDYTQVSGGGIATVACSAGKQALGGGYQWKDEEVAMEKGLSVVWDRPGRMDWTTNQPKEGDFSGWIVRPNKPANVNPGALTVFVICASVN